MKHQLQGITLTLFGIIMMMFAALDPWLPFFGGVLTDLALWAGVICGIAGLITSFKKEG